MKIHDSYSEPIERLASQCEQLYVLGDKIQDLQKEHQKLNHTQFTELNDLLNRGVVEVNKAYRVKSGKVLVISYVGGGHAAVTVVDFANPKHPDTNLPF